MIVNRDLFQNLYDVIKYQKVYFCSFIYLFSQKKFNVFIVDIKKIDHSIRIKKCLFPFHFLLFKNILFFYQTLHNNNHNSKDG